MHFSFNAAKPCSSHGVSAAKTTMQLRLAVLSSLTLRSSISLVTGRVDCGDVGGNEMKRLHDTRQVTAGFHSPGAIGTQLELRNRV